ncbi:MAG: energy transducer TonB [Chitinophagaceae bacterium]|nr:energy transducer TonB [Chitinophagaceae bacterium]MCW5925652.1 energy transducer TonB [Chitinophagaceae bacterium]
MKHKFLLAAIILAAFISSCGNSQEAEQAVDETITTQPSVAEPSKADTPAVVTDYEAAHAKAKPVTKVPEYKKLDKKEVAAYTEEAIVSVAPQNEITDIAGYNYKPDKTAMYPGGEKAFDKYFFKNFRYPQEAIENDIQGTIYAEIFVNEEGYVEKVEFPGRKLGYGLEEETRRVIMATKKLEPAIKNGAPAKARFVLPITMRIQQ